MKILLLILVLGLVCADDGPASEQERSKLTGLWYTIYLASDDISKIEKDGPLRVYARRLDIRNGGKTMAFTFYFKVNGKCQLRTTEGVRGEDNQIYNVDFHGKNYFKIMYTTSQTQMFYAVNEDKRGKTTHLTAIKSRNNHLSLEDYKKYEKETIKLGIPKENILKIIDTDTCPKDVY